MRNRALEVIGLFSLPSQGGSSSPKSLTGNYHISVTFHPAVSIMARLRESQFYVSPYIYIYIVFLSYGPKCIEVHSFSVLKMSNIFLYNY